MRLRVLWAVLLLAAIGGCQRAETPSQAGGAKASGRYQGVGIYRAGQLWPQVARPEAPADPAAARLDDDEEIIVVIDNVTGEVRQCGNLSGHCIATNPWSGAAGALPAALLKHAEDLRREAASAPAN